MRKHMTIAVMAIVFLFVFCLWFGYTKFMCSTSFFNDWSTRGQFGDMYGALNTLFSGFAFVGLIYTLMLQKKTIDSQNKEIEFVRSNMEKQSNLQLMTAKIQAITTLLNRELEKKYPDSKVLDDYKKRIEFLLNNLD